MRTSRALWQPVADGRFRGVLLMPVWAWLAPVLAALVMAAGVLLGVGGALTAVSAAALVGAVVSAVHHAEVIAHRVGEPLGTLILALAVTVIEVAIIVSVMVAGGPDKSAVARDTIFAAVMIICNGVVGLCLLLGGLRHYEQTFRVEGAGSALAVLIALATLSLVLPTFTSSTPGPTYSVPQLAFAGIASLALWATYVFVQTVRHRDYFLPPGGASDETLHAEPPSSARAWASFSLLMLALVAVVGLANLLSPGIAQGIAAAGWPPAVIGIAIALLVLLPETVAAARAAHADRLQTSLNLALGSAVASIGLTIPTVAAASVLLDLPLTLGLDGKDMVLMAVTFLVGAITLGTGRTTLMQGAIHLVLFAAFLFLALVP